jgi:hypothetical protein
VSGISRPFLQSFRKLFTEHEELEVKFNNGCTQLLLNEGKYAFYDLIHGSDAIYQNLSKLLIHKASDFFSQ